MLSSFFLIQMIMYQFLHMAENMVTNTSQVLHLAVPTTRKGLIHMFLDPKIKKISGKDTD